MARLRDEELHRSVGLYKASGRGELRLRAGRVDTLGLDGGALEETAKWAGKHWLRRVHKRTETYRASPHFFRRMDSIAMTVCEKKSEQVSLGAQERGAARTSGGLSRGEATELVHGRLLGVVEGLIKHKMVSMDEAKVQRKRQRTSVSDTRPSTTTLPQKSARRTRPLTVS